NNNNHSSSKGGNANSSLSSGGVDTTTLLDGNVLATATATTELQAEPPPLPPRQPGMLEVVNQNLILNSDNNAGSSSSNGANSMTAASTPNGNNNHSSGRGSIEMRPPPNSINTLMNYPLITTCTSVRDNMAAAFPLSYRPNIVHQMQQHQQSTAMNQSAAAGAGVNQSISKKHRRIVSSPENIGAKDFGMVAGADHHHHHSGGYRHHKTSSDSWDKRSEITPPGTPPPPYLSTSMTTGSPAGGGGHPQQQHHPHHHHHHGGHHPHHHEHTTAGDLAIANPLSSINNNHHHHHQQQHHGNNGTATHLATGPNNINSINNNNGASHMSASYHAHHHHPSHGQQSPVGATNAGGPAGGVGGGTAPGSSIVAAQANVAQKPIISMEDDDISDQESFIEENSPFRSLTQLLEADKSVYLAVFLNFVLTNSDPSALLFYMITMLYKEGTVKDMRKWAYEIHSTFLVPGAPLLCANVDEALARDIDDVLQKENDKAEILRMVFWRSRLKAKEMINQQLQQFQTKRTAGLGTMYGPNDQQLQMAKGDKVKEQRIIDETLLPKLQQYL
uniref:Regulator of G protein signalling-like domain-containing protein n=1 Tax=Anopheles merus TaxID=30066 RepID=A0A182VH61_ANOME